MLDLVILNLPYKKENDIKIIKCKNIQDAFYANKNYENLKNKELSLNELNNYPLVLQAKGSNTRTFLDDVAKENNVTLNPNMELASYSLVTEFTKIGFGIGYLTKEYIQDELKNKELFEIKLKEKIPRRSIGIAYSNKNLPSFATKEMIRIITKK